MKYQIGTIICKTDAFGTVKVIDAFRSIKHGGEQYCYQVQNEGTGETFLCWETDLV